MTNLGKADQGNRFYPNRKTPTSTSGSGTPYSASVTIVSSTIVSGGEYRRSRDL